VYTAKVLAAVPIIRVSFDATEARSSALSLVGGATGFELKQQSGEGRLFELRAKDKLNVAAMIEPARPAFERAATCSTVRDTRARRAAVLSLRELGTRALVGRELATMPGDVRALRARLRASPEAFTLHEQRDLAKCVEAVEGAGRELALGKPTRAVCGVRELLGAVLTGGGEDNRLHALLTDVAQPLHRRMTDLANEYALPCADPAYYRDQDGDGYGDARSVVRAAKPPPGFVANSLDCFDHNRDARPGQRVHFSRPRGDPSFDYDCDGRQTPQTEVLASGCKTITRFGIPIRCWAEPGWRTRVPACGQEGRWFGSCEEGMLTCDEGPDETKRQACR
jgi:hypothetical protein